VTDSYGVRVLIYARTVSSQTSSHKIFIAQSKQWLLTRESSQSRSECLTRHDVRYSFLHHQKFRNRPSPSSQISCRSCTHHRVGNEERPALSMSAAAAALCPTKLPTRPNQKISSCKSALQRKWAGKSDEASGLLALFPQRPRVSSSLRCNLTAVLISESTFLLRPVIPVSCQTRRLLLTSASIGTERCWCCGRGGAVSQ